MHTAPYPLHITPPPHIPPPATDCYYAYGLEIVRAGGGPEVVRGGEVVRGKPEVVIVQNNTDVSSITAPAFRGLEYHREGG